MARRSLTTGPITRAGRAVAPVAVTVDGDVIDANNTILLVDNSGASPATVTVLATATQDGLDVEDQVISVAAGTTLLMGPWPMRTFGQLSGAIESGADDTDRVYVDYSTTTDLASQALTL